MTTLAGLYSVVSGICTNGTLALNASNIDAFAGAGSANPIGTLLVSTQWLSGSYLTMVNVKQPPTLAPGATSIVLTGATQQQALPSSGGSQTIYSVTAIFWVDANGTPQLALYLHMEPGWQLQSAFTWLGSTALGGIAWGQGALVLASVGNGAFSQGMSQGLNFSGPLPSGDPIAWPIELFFSNPATLILVGPITLSTGTSTPTTMQFSTPALASTTRIGSVAPTVSVTAAANSAGTIAVPGNPGVLTCALLTLQAALQVGTGPDAFPLNLSATFTTDGGPIVLSDSPELTLAEGLNELNTLASGSVFGAVIPSHLPLGDDITLATVSLTLLEGFSGPPALATVSVTITLDPGRSWTLIPGILVVDTIAITFAISDPLSNPSLSAAVSAQFEIAGQGPVGVGLSFPQITVVASLSPPTTIDVPKLIEHFFGSGATSPDDGSSSLLSVNQFTLLAQPGTSTYSIQGALGTDLTIQDLFPSVSANDLAVTGLTFTLDRSPTSHVLAFGGTVIFLGATFQLNASNAGAANAPWVFSGYLTSEVCLRKIIAGVLPSTWTVTLPESLGALPITELGASFTPALSIYSLDVGINWPFTVGGDPFVIQATFALASSRAGGARRGEASYSGKISGQLDFNGLVVSAAYEFHPASSEITFDFQTLEAVYAKNATDPTITIRFGNSTLLQMVNLLLDLAVPRKRVHVSAPWDKLLAINLNGLTITVHLLTKEVDVTYLHDFNLGFADITGFKLAYQREYGQGKVKLDLFGSFLGQTYTQTSPLSWDVSNGQPPAMGNLGGAAVDIEYLALGQHVALASSGGATVGTLIADLERALTPPPNKGRNPVAQLPGLAFDAGSDWLIGAQFTLIKTVACSIIFNDPKLYGFLIELGGPKAKALAGLKFEVLYRKITDHLGVYHIELQLPPMMRQMQFGEVSLTLPEIILDIYTNGDFKVDLGFPPSLTNFSHSFSVQVFPFVGFGGFYFGVLDGRTSTTVPHATNGRFDPVIEFGIALSLGVGKTIKIGPLSGGVLVTLLGELQGTLAWFHPTKTAKDTDVFYELVGMVAVVGKVYAEINFGIISASANLTVFASVTVEIEAYEPIAISMSAGVSVSVGIKIVFFTIHFSFSTTVHESFTIGHETTAPWITGPDSRSPIGGTLAGPGGTHSHFEMLAAYRSSGAMTAAGPGPHGQRPQPSQRNARRAGRPLGPSDPMAFLKRSHPANRVGRPGPAMAGRFGRPTPASPPAPASKVHGSPPLPLVPLYATAIVTKALTGDLALSGGGTGASLPAIAVTLVMPDASADTFCSTLFGWWAGSNVDSSGNLSATALLDLKLSLEDPGVVADTLSYSNLSAVFAGLLQISIAPPPAGGPQDAALFPMIPALTLACGSFTADFSTFTSVGASEQQGFDAYTRLFATPTANAGTQPETPPQGTAASFASVMFSDYVTMLLRQLVRAAIETLEKYPVEITDPSTVSLSSLAGQFPTEQMTYRTRTGDTILTIADLVGLTPETILAQNPGLGYGPYATGTYVLIPVQVTATAIVSANWRTPGLLAPTASVPISNATYATQTSDTITSIATALATCSNDTPDQIAKGLITANATRLGLFKSGTSLTVSVSPSTKAADTLQSIAAYWNPAIAATAEITSGATIVLPASCGYAQIKVGTTGNTLAAIATANNIPTAACSAFYSDVLAHNVAIGVIDDQSLGTFSFTFTIEGAAFLLPYQTQTGDTLTTVVEAFFPDATTAEEQETLIERIHAQNPDSTIAALTPTDSLPVGYALKISYPYTLQGLATYLGIGIHALWSTILGTTEVFATGAVLGLPQIAATIQSGDTFATLAARYGLTLTELTASIEATTNCFTGTVALPTTITVPNVPASALSDLTATLQTQGAFKTAVNMASRFFLHGLRLPLPSDPNFESWITSGCQPSGAGALATYPIYALSGQEFTAPSPVPANLAFTLTNSGQVTWLAFTEADPVTVTLSKGEIELVTAYATEDFSYTKMWRLAEANHRWAPTQYPLRHVLPWHPATIPAALSNTGQAAGGLTIWPLPATLTRLLVEAGSGGTPVPLEVATVARTPSGLVQLTTVAPALFATSVNVRIKKLAAQPGTKTPPVGYGIAGIDHEGLQRILSVWTHWSDLTVGLHLLYPPNGSGTNAAGYLSEALYDTGGESSTFLLRSNLSPLTRGSPSTLLYQAALSDGADFLQLLFEAGSTVGGGYYLSYQTADGVKALPEDIFTRGDEATITLMILPAAAPATAVNQAYDFNNVVVLGQKIDLSQDHVLVQQPARQVQPGDTLTSLAAAFGDALTPGLLASANQSITGLLRPGTTVGNTSKTHTITPHDTIVTVTTALGQELAEFATMQAANGLLFQPGAFIQASSGQLAAKPMLPPGTVGFQLAIADPTAGGTITQPTSQQRLDNLFSLLGFEIGANAEFIASGEGLPAGPTRMPGSDSGTDPGGPTQTPLWFFDHNLHVGAFAAPSCLPFSSPALPVAAQSPYAGTAAGSTVNVSFTFQDVLGNQPATASEPPTLQVPVLYTDALLSPDRWPSLARSYAFASGTGTPTLTVSLDASPNNYIASPSLDFGAALAAAQAAEMHYRRIWYQLAQPDVTATISTSVGILASQSTATTLDAEAGQALLDAAGGAYVMTAGAANLTAVIYTTVTEPVLDTLSSVATAYSLTPEALAEANADLPLVSLFATSSIALPVFVTATSAMAPGAFVTNAVTLADLASGNAQAPLTQGLSLAWPSTTLNTITPPLGASLADLAVAQNVAIADGPPGSGGSVVAGLASCNATVALTAGLTLTLSHHFPTGPSRILTVTTSSKPADATGTLAEVATAFQDQISGGDPTANVTAADVAMANLHVGNLFAAGATVTIPSVVVPKGATLKAFAANLVDADDGTALLTFNSSVFGMFETGTAIRQGSIGYTLAADDSFRTLADQNHVAIAEIAFENQGASLAGAQPLEIPAHATQGAATTYSVYQASGKETLNTIIGTYDGWTATEFLALNAQVPAIFAPGATISVASTSVAASLSDSLASLAVTLGVTPTAVLTAIGSTANLIRAGALVYAPPASAAAGQTFAEVVATYWPGAPTTAAAGLWAAMNATLQGLIPKNQNVGYGSEGATLTTGANETLATLAARINAALGSSHMTPALLIASNPALKLAAMALLCPAPTVTVVADVTAAIPAGHFPLGVEIEISRSKAAVDPAFLGTRAEKAKTSLMPDIGSGQAKGLTLADFAMSFEAAFPNLKLATGPSAACAGAASPMGRAIAGTSKAPSLWAVNFAPAAGSPGYSYTPSSAANPRFIALAPLTTAPWSKPDAKFPGYVSGSGLTGEIRRNIVDGRPDDWAAQLFELIDQALAPQNALAAQVLAGDDLSAIASAKADLADLFSKRFADIFGDGLCTNDDGCRAAQQTAYQQMMAELGSGYRINAVVQIPFKTLDSGAAAIPPRFFGKPSAALANTGSNTTVAALATALNLGATHVARVLENQSFIIAPGIALELNGAAPTYTTTPTDTLATIAAALDATIEDVAAGKIKPTAASASLFRDSVPINAVVLAFPTSATATFAGAAAAFGTTVHDLVEANWPTPGLFATGTTVSFSQNGPSVTIASSDSPKSIAGALGLTRQAFADAIWLADNAIIPGVTNAYALASNQSLQILKLVPKFDLSAAALACRSSGGAATTSYANFLLTLKDAAFQSSLTLPLSYEISGMEVDLIASGIDGFDQSSSLTFIVPISASAPPGTGNSGVIGQTTIPIILRAFPSVGSLDHQRVILPTGKKPAELVTDWNYGITAKRPIAAQDEMTLSLVFNEAAIPDGGGSSGTGFGAVFEGLAAVGAAREALKADLATLASPTAGAVATNALAALRTLARTVVKALKSSQGTAPDVPTPPANGYNYAITPVASETTLGSFSHLSIGCLNSPKLFVTSLTGPHASAAASALDALKPIPETIITAVGDAGFTLAAGATITVVTKSKQWTITDGVSRLPQTYAVYYSARTMLIYRALLWPVVNGADSGLVQAQDRLLVPFSAAIGQTTPIALKFEHLDVLAQELALSQLVVTRNATLVSGHQTNSLFVYYAGPATAPTAIQPSITSSVEIPIRSYTLGDALQSYIDRVLLLPLALTGAATSKYLRLEASYRFPVNGDVGAQGPVAEFPLALSPAHSYAIAGGDTFPTRFGKAVDAAATAAGVPPGMGYFAVKLKIMTTAKKPGGEGTVTRPGATLLELSNLTFMRF